MDLCKYGWDSFFEENFRAYQNQGLIAGRVFLEHKHLYRLYTERGELLGEVSGKFRYAAQGSQDYPAVGDWVAVNVLPGEERAIIHGVLPRKSKLSRKAARNETQEQIIAANLDRALIVSSLNRDFNPRRLERYLTLVWESGANPVIVLSKADLCDDLSEKLAQTEAVAFGVPAHVISVYNGTGIDELSAYFTAAKTVVILGSSGVGKSTLINCLAGKELLEVNSIREDDDRGRHTTTHRQLVCLPSGGLIIDTPGMRELALWSDDESLEGTFEDIEALAKECRFRDCRHHQEPGCAVKQAILSGTLSSERLANYQKLRKELRYLESRQDQLIRSQEKQKMKQIAKAIKSINQKKQNGG